MICESCGYRNQGDVKNCSGCGKTLAPKMSGEQSDAMLTKMVNRLSDNSDNLTPSPTDKVMKWVFFAAALILFVLMLIFTKQIGYALILAFFSIIGGINAGYPNFLWELEKLRLSFSVNNSGDMTPSDFWSFGRKLSYWIILVMVVVFFVSFLSNTGDRVSTPNGEWSYEDFTDGIQYSTYP